MELIEKDGFFFLRPAQWFSYVSTRLSQVVDDGSAKTKLSELLGEGTDVQSPCKMISLERILRILSRIG
jgi:hypothetical protein